MNSFYFIRYFYVSTVGLAFLSSLISFRLDLPFYLKLFSTLLGITFLVEFTMIFESMYFTNLLQHMGFVLPNKPVTFSKYLNKTFKLRGNAWLYNPFTLVEFWAYIYYYSKIITLSTTKIIIHYLLWLFPIFWFVTVFFIFGFAIFNSYVIIVGATITVLLVLAYLYQLLQSEDVILLKVSTEFWIAIGMLVFYTCQIPYFGALNFLIKNYQTLAESLLRVLQIVDSIMYLLFAYAFLCRINIKKF